MRNVRKKAVLLAALGIFSCSGFGANAEAAAAIVPAVHSESGVSSAGIQQVSTISQVYGDGEKPAAVVNVNEKVSQSLTKF